MTLNLTHFRPECMVQMSDRRMITIPGKIVDDDANKGVVLETVDGLYAITFAGIGKIRDKRVDLWLAGLMVDEGVPETPLENSLDLIARKSAEWFASIPSDVDKRHSFVIAGWRRVTNGTQAVIHIISNCAGKNHSMTNEAMNDFTVKTLNPTNGILLSMGQHKAISRLEKRRLKRSLKAARSLDETEAHMIRAVRNAADHPELGQLVGRDVMSIAISRDSVALATLYPNQGRRTNYAPLHVWNSGFINVVAGDATIHGTDYAYKFGRTMLVGNIPSGGQLPDINDVIQNAFRTRIAKAKFNKDKPNPDDIHMLVEIHPVSERAKRAMSEQR